MRQSRDILICRIVEFEKSRELGIRKFDDTFELMSCAPKVQAKNKMCKFVCI